MRNNRNYIDVEMQVVSAVRCGRGQTLLKLRAGEALPEIAPGQFVNVLAPRSAGVLLRRPISVCNADASAGSLWLLVKDLGRGSRAISECRQGDRLRILLPLGHGFTTGLTSGCRALLIGGGVGIAPLLYLGRKLAEKGIMPEFMLGGRSQYDLPLREEFEKYGLLHIATEDGSSGEKCLVTEHSRFAEGADMIYCCGPLPMMKAVAKAAAGAGIECEVSLENKMACGLGACLCCVEDTTDGNLCTCTHGPVFNIKNLKW